MFIPVGASADCKEFDFSGNPHSVILSGSHMYYNHYGTLPDNDEDLDFLNDQFEYEIAEHFKPQIWCYENDESCYGGPEDPTHNPIIFFQVSPIDITRQYDEEDLSPIVPPEYNSVQSGSAPGCCVSMDA